MITYFLHSVGTALDADSLMTYPIAIDGTVAREGEGVHLADCCGEWWTALGNSCRDTQIVGRVWR